MAFGPKMRLVVDGLEIELAPIPKEAVTEFITGKGGLQQHSVTRYMGMGSAPVAEDEFDWFDKIRQQKDSLIWGVWVVKNGDRTLIGNTGLVDIDKDGHSHFIRQATSGSMLFRQEYWGRGIASAIHKARTWYAFQHLGLHRIKSAVIQPNVGSRKALERSGYFLVYTERNEQYGDGQLQHLDCLECLNPLDLFWSQWWHGDRPTRRALEAKRRTQAALQWARDTVELL